jgi:hypothetical protein
MDEGIHARVGAVGESEALDGSAGFIRPAGEAIWRQQGFRSRQRVGASSPRGRAVPGVDRSKQGPEHRRVFVTVTKSTAWPDRDSRPCEAPPVGSRRR